MKIKISRTLLLYILIGLLIYGFSLGNGFVGDDQGLVVNNQIIHNLSNIGGFFKGGNFNNYPGSLNGIYYKPVVSVVLSFIYFLVGNNAFFFHLVQLCLHIVNSFLLFIFFKRIFGHKTSFVLGLIFLVHPANVESVAYISSLQEVLFFLFGMLALINISKHQVTSNALLLFSLLTKETGIFFVFAAILQYYIFDRPRLIKALGFSATVLIIYSFMRFAIAGVFFNQDAISPIMRAGIVTRLETIPKVISTYFLQLVFPLQLLSKQNWLVNDINFQNFYAPLGLIFLIISAVAICGYKIRHEPHFKNYVFFSLCFMAAISIHSQIIPLDNTFADRWLYSIFFGFLGLLGILLEKLRIRYFITALIILFSFRSLTRSLDWKDNYTLVSRDIVNNIDSFTLESTYGALLLDRGEFDKAKIHLDKSVKLFPTFMNWSNLAILYERTGDRQKTVEAYKEAFKYGNYYLSARNFTLNMLVLDKNEEAAGFAEKETENFTDDPYLWEYLAIAKYRLGDKVFALEAARRAYSLNQNEETTYVLQTIKNGENIKFQ